MTGRRHKNTFISERENKIDGGERERREREGCTDAN
jgi:hypothetical protein